MKLHVAPRTRIWTLGLSFFLCQLALSQTVEVAAPPPPQEKLPAVFNKPAPENVAELRAIQERVKAVVKKVMTATVGVQIGPGAGSGVIISPDGYVLTAGHVSGEPDQKCTLILSDGRRIRGKTLGWNQGMDSGLIKITDEGPWPYVEMGRSSDLKPGQWCVALGHPGGYRPGRTPVVRLGNILTANNRLIQTSCKLVGGDSGGPLFDMSGRVIGIHSRIGFDINGNIHVPINSFREDWDQLVEGKKWGGLLSFLDRPASRAYMGVVFEADTDNLKITEVPEGTPAAQAGIRAGDILEVIDGKQLNKRAELMEYMMKKKPGESVTVQVRRGEEQLKFTIKLVRRPSE